MYHFIIRLSYFKILPVREIELWKTVSAGVDVLALISNLTAGLALYFVLHLTCGAVQGMHSLLFIKKKWALH